MSQVKRISLGLQGGGAHGAFTWGALDRLLDDERIEIAAISGTSAGALNGAALKSGMVRDGRAGARAALDDLWHRIGAISDQRLGAWVQGVDLAKVSQALTFSLPFAMADALTRVVSPYAYGPFYRNPLRGIVDGFDFDEVCAHDGPQLCIGATCVRTGKIRVFKGHEISTDAILASACLPTLFQAVEIPDPATGRTEAYWDGGYSGNPALFPLFSRELPGDIVIININPLERAEVPKAPHDIQNRINEISFNSSLLRELRAIAFVQRLLDQGKIAETEMKRLRVHMIADDALMNDLSVATKLLPTPVVVSRMKAAGSAAAEAFLQRHFDDIGNRGSVDLRAMLD
jgi:NTE family protein